MRFIHNSKELYLSRYLIVKNLIIGYTYLPKLEIINPTIDVQIANELNLKKCFPSIINNKYCSTLPNILEFLNNKPTSEYEVSIVVIFDFPSLIKKDKLGEIIFGDGITYLILEHNGKSKGLVVEKIKNVWIPETQDKVFQDKNKLHLTDYMSNYIPSIIIDNMPNWVDIDKTDFFCVASRRIINN